MKPALAKVIDAVAWPSVALVAILLLRKPVAELIARLTSLKFKWKDIEAEAFRRELEEAKQSADKLTMTSATTTTTPPPDYEPASEKYGRLISVSPAAGIAEAWRDIEVELQTLAQRCGLETRLPTYRLLETVRESVAIDDETFDLLQRLRKLRNEASHGRVEVSTLEATEYSDLAVRALTRLRNLGG